MSHNTYCASTDLLITGDLLINCVFHVSHQLPDVERMRFHTAVLDVSDANTHQNMSGGSSEAHSTVCVCRLKPSSLSDTRLHNTDADSLMTHSETWGARIGDVLSVCVVQQIELQCFQTGC